MIVITVVEKKRRMFMMKKKITFIFFSAIIIAFLGACGKGEENSQQGNTNKENIVQESGNESEKKPALNEKKEETAKIIDLNEKMEFPEHAEVVITNVEFTDKVEPSNPEGLYYYYEEKGEGDTFLHITGTFKNLESDTVDVEWDDPVKIQVKYQEKYNYDGFIVIEKSDGSDFDISVLVDPLKEVRFHYLFSVPKEVESSDGALDLTISYEKNKFKMNIR